MYHHATYAMLDIDRKHRGLVVPDQRMSEGVSMLPNQTSRDMAQWPIAAGMTVYGSDGEKLGTLRTFDQQTGYLDIQKGWLFHKDFYVPLGGVTAVDEDGITLRLTKEDLDDERYGMPPTGGLPYNEGAVLTQKEPLDVVDEEVPVRRTAESGFVS
jgi:hypothetical protein